MGCAIIFIIALLSDFVNRFCEKYFTRLFLLFVTGEEGADLLELGADLQLVVGHQVGIGVQSHFNVDVA